MWWVFHMKSDILKGKIKQYHADKGFGFIVAEGQDIFFHISDFPAEGGEPKRNERVKFKVIENDGKYKAVKIERVTDLSTKAKKSRVAAHNQAITSTLLSQFKK